MFEEENYGDYIKHAEKKSYGSAEYEPTDSRLGNRNRAAKERKMDQNWIIQKESEQNRDVFFNLHHTPMKTRRNGVMTFARSLKLLNPTGHVMHQQFNIQQLYALPTLYLCVLYLSENKPRLVPLTV